MCRSSCGRVRQATKWNGSLSSQEGTQPSQAALRLHIASRFGTGSIGGPGSPPISSTGQHYSLGLYSPSVSSGSRNRPRRLRHVIYTELVSLMRKNLYGHERLLPRGPKGRCCRVSLWLSSRCCGRCFCSVYGCFRSERRRRHFLHQEIFAPTKKSW